MLVKSYLDSNCIVSPKSHLSGFLSFCGENNFQSVVPSMMSCTVLLFVIDPTVMMSSVVPSRDSPPLCSIVILLWISSASIDPMRLTDGAEGSKEKENTT